MTNFRQTSSKRRDNERRNIIIKFVIMIVLGVIIFVLATIAWFAMNGSIDNDGMDIVVGTKPYTITCLANGSDGLFFDYYEETDPEEGTMVWQMTANNNMENYDDPTDKGIKPGSSGKISFIVTPNTSTVTINFKLEIIGYSCSESTVNGEPVITMNEISSGSVSNLLNGHILLFENCTNEGIYSGPITSNADAERIFSRTFAKADGPQTVDIYWVWPEHLSHLVNAYDGNIVNEHPKLNTSSEDYTKVVTNICAYPEYYFAGTVPEQNLTEQIIAGSYNTYGGLYDAADNDIGTGVDFILVRMSTVDGE